MRFVMYLLVFLGLAAVILGYAAWVYASDKAKKTEAFRDASTHDAADDDPKNDDVAKAGRASYDARLYVLQTFDSVLHRKPTEEELSKYSSLAPQSAIMAAIVADYGKDASTCAGKSGTGVSGKSKSRGQHKRHGRHGDGSDGSDSSDSSDSSGSESDDSESSHGPKNKRGAPVPYTPEVMHRATEASPDLGWPAPTPEKDKERGGSRDHRPVPAVTSAAPATSVAPVSSKHGRQDKDAGNDPARVCLDRADLQLRIQGISDQVDQFKQFLRML
jgi:hypothetical protein